ncbi:MAG: PAS domain S-box protein [Candidatus Aminicenantales bacterium]
MKPRRGEKENSSGLNVTKGKETDQERRANEIWLSMIYNNVHDVIFVVDVEPDDRFRFVSVNRRFLEVTGLMEDQIVGRLVHEVIPEPAHALVFGKYREAIRTRQSARWEEVSVYPAGIRVGEVTVAPIYDSAGNGTQLIGTVHDITERKRAEDALQESEEKYRTLVEYAAEAILIVQDGKLKFVNRMSGKISGFSESELLSSPFLEFIHPDDRKVVGERYLKRLQGDTSVAKYEFRLMRKDGGIKWVELNAVLVTWEGRPATLNFLNDITERRRAEGMLVKSEKRFRELSDLLPQIIFETDIKGNLTFANKYGIKSFGYSPEEFQSGINIFALFAPEDREGVQRRLGEVLSGSETDIREFQGRRKDGNRFPLLVHATAILEDGQTIGIRGIAIDITERKRAEEVIQASLREKEVLLREIHHRVKNNMQVISSLFNLQAGKTQNRECREILKDGQTRIRAMSLVHEKLYQSRDLSKIDLAVYIQSLVLHLFHVYLADSHQVRLETDFEEVYLDVNSAVPCGLILNELISNCLKHAFPVGRKGIIRLGVKHGPDETIILRVADDGIGFPKDFDFRQAEGLGLQITNLLVGQLEATIDLDRTNGIAFTVTFRKPIYTSRS